MWVVKHVEKFWLKSSGHTFPFLSRFTVGCEDDLLSVLLLPTQPVWLETGQCLRLSWRPLRDPSAFSCLALKEPFSILPRKSKSSFTRLTEGKQEKEHREDGSLLNTAPDSRFPASPSLQPVNRSVKIKEWEFTGPERSQKVRTHHQPTGLAYWWSGNLRPCQFLANKTSSLLSQILDLLFPTQY